MDNEIFKQNNADQVKSVRQGHVLILVSVWWSF